MYSIFFALILLNLVDRSNALCNAWYSNGMPYLALNVCSPGYSPVTGPYAVMYTCGDDDDELIAEYWRNEECNGDSIDSVVLYNSTDTGAEWYCDQAPCNYALAKGYTQCDNLETGEFATTPFVIDDCVEIDDILEFNVTNDGPPDNVTSFHALCDENGIYYQGYDDENCIGEIINVSYVVEQGCNDDNTTYTEIQCDITTSSTTTTSTSTTTTTTTTTTESSSNLTTTEEPQDSKSYALNMILSFIFVAITSTVM